jgi:hypothetical protein
MAEIRARDVLFDVIAGDILRPIPPLFNDSGCKNTNLP